jgi:hypothetical protein
VAVAGQYEIPSSEFDVVEIQAGHGDMFDEPQAQRVAAKLAASRRTGPPEAIAVGSTDDGDGTDSCLSGSFGSQLRLSRENEISMPRLRRNLCALRSRPASARGFLPMSLPSALIAPTLRAQTQRI